MKSCPNKRARNASRREARPGQLPTRQGRLQRLRATSADIRSCLQATLAQDQVSRNAGRQCATQKFPPEATPASWQGRGGALDIRGKSLQEYPAGDGVKPGKAVIPNR